MNKKELLIIIVYLFLLFILAACSSDKEKETTTNLPNNSNNTQEEGEQMILVYLTIDSVMLEAYFYDNVTTQDFISQLPLTLELADLNGNEKYHYLSANLSVIEAEQPNTIYEGEIMCWSKRTLVLFYDTFTNSYGGYVKLGYIKDPTNLKELLGNENITITFSLPK